ncbi:MAG TPA: type II secretion system protein N [bacterium]|nr:type II secretion system protein N [bacterium]HOL35935.1 type II secretion system protein N [bacterium]HPP09182.1 type II secretion system protein N [bacterium]
MLCANNFYFVLRLVRVLSFLSLFLVFSSFSANDYSLILKRKIFADPPPSPQKPVRSILKPTPSPSLESLITLKGIIYSPDADSRAIIEILSKKAETLIAEGDIIENARLVKINENNVIFYYDDKEITLNLPKPQIDSKSGIAVKDTSIKVATSLPSTETTLSATGPITSSSSSVPVPQQPKNINLNALLDQVRSDPSVFSNISVTPFIEEGRVEGFTVNRIPEGGMYSQIGVQPGDVIKRVNGTLIDSLSKAYAVYNNIINSQTKLVTVEILRNGQPMILTYRLD